MEYFTIDTFITKEKIIFMCGNPVISIIIPVYNVKEYLVECINSVILQNIDGWEVILVDDGSTDGSNAICDEYAIRDRRIHVVHQQNSGVSVARNVGLKIAQGEWISFVDADDALEEHALYRLFNFVGSNNNVDLIQSGMSYVKDNGVSVIPCYCTEYKNDRRKFLYTSVSNHVFRILFRRRLICDYGLTFSKGVRMGEDQEFILKYLLLCKEPMQIGEIYYLYRVRNNSASHSNVSNRNAVKDMVIVLENWIDFFREYQVTSEPWLEMRLERFMKTILNAASHIKGLNRRKFKQKIKNVMETYRHMGFVCFNSQKMKLASYNITIYFMFLSIYKKWKGIS